MNSGEGNEGLLNKTSVVTSLHAILKPFLLRRLKVDVEKDLPPKKEYLLYAPLTKPQKDIYQAIVSGQIRQFLVDKKAGPNDENEPVAEIEEQTDAETEAQNGPKVRKQARKSYKIEENDSKYLRDLEDGIRPDEPNGVIIEKSATEIGREWQMKQASKLRLLTRKRR